MCSDAGLPYAAANHPSGIAQRNPVPALVSSGTEKASQAALKSAYGRLPLHFEPNVGQFDPHVRYVSHASGYSLFLTDDQAVVVLAAPANGRTAIHCILRTRRGRWSRRWCE